MDRAAVFRATARFERRGQLDRVEAGEEAASLCLARAQDRLRAAQVLMAAELWESAFTTAYDAYRTAADAVALSLGFRVPATNGAHRIATDIAHAALHATTQAFATTAAERFRRERHESEYFDPARPIDKTMEDAAWALDLAAGAVNAVARSLSRG